jgi:short-subunit dehydrogenase
MWWSPTLGSVGPMCFSPSKVKTNLTISYHLTTNNVLSHLIDSEEPEKPELKIVNVNMIGVMYTMKLARHYFMKHPLDKDHDRCFIINASLVGFLDVPGVPQYMAAKWGCRALMRCLRRTTMVDGVRANLTGPWYVGTSILSPQVQEYCKGKGIVFAEAADCAGAMLKIASDPSINGKMCCQILNSMSPPAKNKLRSFVRYCTPGNRTLRLLRYRKGRLCRWRDSR